MSHHDTTCLSGNGTGRVGRTIIDDEGAISSALDVGDDVRDHRCLIVGSDDNPYLRSLRRHRYLAMRKSTDKISAMQITAASSAATWRSERRPLIGLASAARRAWHRIN